MVTVASHLYCPESPSTVSKMVIVRETLSEPVGVVTGGEGSLMLIRPDSSPVERGPPLKKLMVGVGRPVTVHSTVALSVALK